MYMSIGDGKSVRVAREKNAAVMLKDIYGFGLFFVVLGRGHVLGHKNGEIFWRRMSLWDRVLVKMCKFFLKKVAKKIGLWGKMVVPLQPQTGNGGSHRGKSPTGDLAEREKVATFAEPTLRGSGEDIEMMLQTI